MLSAKHEEENEVPFVLILTDPRSVPDPVVETLSLSLPQIVAGELSFSGEGELTEEDISVLILDIGPFDHPTHPLQIIIWAGLYPERQHNLDERRERIVQRIKAILPKDLHGFVWVLLQPQSFEAW